MNHNRDNSTADALSERLLAATPVTPPSFAAAPKNSKAQADYEHEAAAQQQQEPLVVATATTDTVSATGGNVAMYPNDEEGGQGDVMVGETQPLKFRDAWAGVLFVMHQVAIFYLAFAWGLPSLSYDADDNNNNHNNNADDSSSFAGIVWLCAVSSIVALVLSAAALSLLIRWAERLVELSLLVTVVMNLFVLVVGVFYFHLMVIIPISLFGLLVSACFAWSVWRRIPFAAANLRTAVTAIQSNGGTVLVSVGLSLFLNVWSLVWLLAVLGVYIRKTVMKQQQLDDDEALSTHVQGMAFFLLSYYWTMQVGKNVLQVTTAGVVGTWWFAPEDANRFCSPAITDSLTRATTYSFGSICLGSLLTAVLQVLHHVARQARQQAEERGAAADAILLCVLACVADCLERIVAYFNKWAYIYVGLYGYDYLTAGKQVIALFQHRGWTTIVHDDLILRTLSLVSFMIGTLTGLAGLLLVRIHPAWLAEYAAGYDRETGNPVAISAAGYTIAFAVPLLLGSAVAYVFLNVVAAAVDTIIVCFAEAPIDMERNHPGLYQNMMHAWARVYPDEFTTGNRL